MRALTSAVVVLVLACDPNKVTAPPPPIPTPPQVTFTATGAPAARCQPTVSVSVAGPVGMQLTWVGMGVHVDWTPPYDDNFDVDVARRFWAGDGLAAGEATSSNSMGFGGPAPMQITMRFRYQLTGSATTYADSVMTQCT